MVFRRINRQHVAAIVRKLGYADTTARRTAKLVADLRKYNPRDVAALFELPEPDGPPIKRKSKYARDYKNPYSMGRYKTLKVKVLAAIFQSKICPICRRAFLSRRADAKTCSPKCRTALHRRRS
jgi:hypothetical protein